MTAPPTIATPQDSAAGSGSDHRLVRRVPPFSTPDLDSYCLSAPRKDREFIRQQQMDAHANNAITCRCGFRRWIGFAFRCFYCGEWMCMACAETHFGKTLHQWRVEKRVQLRKEIEDRKAASLPNVPAQRPPANDA